MLWRKFPIRTNQVLWKFPFNWMNGKPYLFRIPSLVPEFRRQEINHECKNQSDIAKLVYLWYTNFGDKRSTTNVKSIKYCMCSSSLVHEFWRQELTLNWKKKSIKYEILRSKLISGTRNSETRVEPSLVPKHPPLVDSLQAWRFKNVAQQAILESDLNFGD